MFILEFQFGAKYVFSNLNYDDQFLEADCVPSPTLLQLVFCHGVAALSALAIACRMGCSHANS